MTLPLSRDYTAVDGVSQFPAATDQRIQDSIVGVYGGGKSVIALSVDGVGNKVVTPPALLVVGQDATVRADTGTAAFRDSAGNVRTAFDHLGYPAGRRSEFRENWEYLIFVNTILSQAAITTGLSRWFATTTNGTRNQIQTAISGGAGAGGSYIQAFFNAAAAADKCIMYGGYPWVKPQTFSSIVMEFEFQLLSPANATSFIGLTGYNGGAGVAPSNTTPWIGFAQQDVSGVNWKLLHGDGTTLVYTDLGIARDALWHQVRIELHGSGSPYGACARVFLDGVQRGGDITTNIPTAANLAANDALTPQFGMLATGVSSAAVDVGPLYLTYNRVALNSPML